MKPVLFSGIQPTGRLHIGNYLGALKHFVELQDSGNYDCYFCVVDLHSLTLEFDPKEKPKQILELAADFLAAGLDPKKSVIFQQSQVAAHSELTWMLNTITPMGELERMTQYKDKARRAERASAGLFDYPVLMAADVLLYHTSVVPVGDDQLQHLELTRTLVRRWNARFGKTFVEPKSLLTRTPRVMSLKDPARKMSKSEPDGCLFLDDAPESIRTKISRAVTDSGSEISYDPARKPGLSNLIEMYAALANRDPKTIAKEFSGKKYSDFKRELADLVDQHFAGFREKKHALLAKPKALSEILYNGSLRAAKSAEKTMAEAKKKIGLAV